MVGISHQLDFPEMIRKANYSPSQSKLDEIKAWMWEVRYNHDDINEITGRLAGLLANLAASGKAI